MSKHDDLREIHYNLASHADRICRTSTLRHTQKLDSLPQHLSQGEFPAFIVEGNLYGTLRADVFVVTDQRLLVIRKNGKTNDSYALSSLAHIELVLPDNGQRVLFTATFDGETWRAFLPTISAAIVFASSLRLCASILGDGTLQDPVAIDLPPELSISLDSPSSPYLLKRYNLDDEQIAMWLPSIANVSDRLVSHELVLGMIGFLTTEDNDTFAAALTSHRLLLMSDSRSYADVGEEPFHATVTSISPSDLRRHTLHQPINNAEARLELRTSQEALSFVVPLPIDSQEESYQDIADDLENWAKASLLFNPLKFPIQALQVLKEDPASLPLPLPGSIEGLLESPKPGAHAFAPESQTMEPVESVDRGDLPDDPSDHSTDVKIETTVPNENTNYAETMLEIQQRVGGATEKASRRYSPETIDHVTSQYEAACLDLDFPVTRDLLRRLAILDLLLRRAEPSLEGNLDIWRKEMLSLLRAHERDRDETLEYWDTAQTRIDEAIDLLFELDPDSEYDNSELAGVLDMVTEDLGIPIEYRPSAIHNLSDAQRDRCYELLVDEIGDPQILVKGELAHLPTVMMPDELLLWLASGILKSTGKAEKGGGFSLIALTDRRILILDKRFLGGVQTISIDLDRVNSVSGDTGLIIGTGSVRIQDGGDERHIGWMTNSTVQPFVIRVQQAIEARKRFLAEQQAGAIAAASPVTEPATPHAQPASPNSLADELEKLANLMDRGILTPEEFAEQKAKLLSG